PSPHAHPHQEFSVLWSLACALVCRHCEGCVWEWHLGQVYISGCARWKHPHSPPDLASGPNILPWRTPEPSAASGFGRTLKNEGKRNHEHLEQLHTTAHLPGTLR
ncbi:unnamed protein product, partial [Tetraodon nigroviridis]